MPSKDSKYIATPSLWEYPTPTTTAEAIDRLASAVVILLGRAIP
jgi:hypothetical protein